jgi:ribose transport system permease protein
MDNQTTVTKLAFSRKLRRTGVKLKADMAAKGKQKLIILLALVALFLIFAILNGNFVDSYNIVSMAQSLAPYAIMSLFVTFVIATGGIDLSIGTVCIASAVVAGKMYTLEIIPLWATIPVMIAIGTFFGIINGFLVAKAKLPNFIATLGTMMFARGMSALIVKDPNIFFPTGTWYNKVFSNANGVPVGIFWVLGIMLVCMYIMYKNKVGRYILSIGSNEEATRLSGINTDKYKIIAYTLSGMGAGIAAIFWSASFTTVAAATGNGMELDAIAGVYIGGTSAAGGVASVIGSVIGAMMLVVIRSGLNFVLAKFNLQLNATYVTFVLTGIIVVFAVLMDVIKEKNAAKVKIESDADKYKRETKETIEEYKQRLDLLISDRSIQASERQQQVEALKKELQSYKLERKAGIAALKK